jgi:hypothetical protein
MTDAQPPADPFLAAVQNLTRTHREHEKFYSQAPLEDALLLLRYSRTLMALAERWSTATPAEHPVAAPFAGAADLNDPRAIETSGVLFMEGDEAPAEIISLRHELDVKADGFRRSGEWLTRAMEIAWGTAEALLAYPQLADLLGERHRIISNDALNGSLALLIGRNLERAGVLLDKVDFTPAGVRADLAGPRSAPAYIFSACELIDRAADLAAQSAVIVHDNERRWRVFGDRVAALAVADAA